MPLSAFFSSFGLLMSQTATRVGCAADVDRGIALLDIRDLSLLIDNERRAVGDSSIRH